MNLPLLEPTPIPARLHVIWVGSAPPDWVKQRWDAWNQRALLDGWEMWVWTDETVNELLPLSSVLKSHCPHPAIYSDFIRIEAVSVYGGVYIDSDTWPLNPLTSLAGDTFPWVSSDTIKSGKPQVTNAAFASPPGSRLLSRVWEIAIDRLATRQFDLIHYYAGPVVWAQAVNELSTLVIVLPPEAFSPLPWRARRRGIPKAVADLPAFAAEHLGSYALHEYEQSWNKRAYPMHPDEEDSQ